CPRIEDAGRLPGQQAAFDQHFLHHADIVSAEVERGDAAAVTATAHAAASAAEPCPWSGGNDIDDPAALVQDYDLVVHDEEAVVAEGGEHVDQRRECRDGNHVDV